VQTSDLLGHIASIRASVAVALHQTETIIVESHRALDLLDPVNLPVRTATIWTLGYAYQLQGNHEDARKAYVEAIAASEAIGHKIIAIMSKLDLGNIQEIENRLYLAADTYQSVLQLAGDPPMPAASEAHLGLGRIYYEWNDLDKAEQHGQISVRLAKQLEATDRVVAGQVFLAKLMFARGDERDASAILTRAELTARQHHFVNVMPQITAIRMQIMLREGDLSVVADLAMNYKEESLQSTILKAIIQFAQGDKKGAVALVGETLALAEPEGIIRSFIDIGKPMIQLLDEAHSLGFMPDYTAKLIAEFPAAVRVTQPSQSLIESLSQREIEILQLIAQGYSNEDIGRKLFLALSTVKGHNRNIFEKLQVQRRTEAVALAHKLGLIRFD
jgi:LuxR family maltose regulon positive regulatory protein